MGFGVTRIYIILFTKPTCSTGSHNVIIVLVLLVIRIYSGYVGRKSRPLGLLPDIR